MKKQFVTLLMGLLITFMIIGLSIFINKNKEVDRKKVEEGHRKDGVETSTELPEENDIEDTFNKNKYTLHINVNEKGVEISDMLYGLFFEDINFAADGGIYGELIKNRSFEYTEERANNGVLHGYKAIGEATLMIDNKEPLNDNNTTYLTVVNEQRNPAGFINHGFLEGIHYEEGESYRFSVYIKSKDYNGSIRISLMDYKNNVIGSNTIHGITKDWVKHTVQIKANGETTSGRLTFELMEKGSVDVDMVSLFPVDTYKNRENGLRKDMVEIIEKLNPSFIRFPGGCIVEGDSLETVYHWKDTIGDVADRKQNTNLWIGTREHPYYQSYGLGYYEYLLLCEDLGAEPVPVVHAGLSCQFRSNEVATIRELDEHIQDTLDLIEFCNGDVNTYWGGIRASMGHPEPFNLKYLAIGNENWDAAYFSNYTRYVKAIRSAYPELLLITSSGPHASGGSFNYAWNTLEAHQHDDIKYADLVDEHYYNPADWFLANTHRYDNYKRDFVDVFVGEYAAKSNSLYAAVAEAAYMTGLERNSDVVKMASYAPLFGNLISRQWSPDLIYFNNHMAFGSINYYVQSLFANNKGDYIIPSKLDTQEGDVNKVSGKIGIGTWLTSAVFDDIKVVNNDTREVLYESSFDNLDEWSKTNQGDWKLTTDDGNNAFIQSNTTYPNNGAIMGSSIYIGDESWSNYTYSLRAKKLAGSEGFLIPFAVKDGENFYHWNIGGWGNKDTCIEQAIGGSKVIVSDVKNLPVRLNEWYDIRIEVKSDRVRCYLNDTLIHTLKIEQFYPVYETVSYDKDSKEMIIKLVNAGEEGDIIIDIENGILPSEEGSLSLLTGSKSSLENTILKQENVIPLDSKIKVASEFTYKAPAYSVSIIRIPMEEIK